MGVELTGDRAGYPILWCHGGLSSRLDALSLGRAAQDAGAAIVSIDRPGIGTSAKRPQMSVAEWAEVALREMTTQGHERFSVAGWSAGGPYALACAAAAPERVEKVATIASMHPIDDPRYLSELGMKLDRVLFKWAVDHPARARAMVRAGSYAPEWMVINDVVKSSVPAERQILRGHAKLINRFLKEATRCGCEGVVHDYARLAADWGFDMGSIKCDVTLWHGSDDPLVPVDHGRDLAARLPTGEFRELPERGHFLPFTDAAAILEGLVSAI